MTEAVFVGSIGSTSPELSRFMLDSQEILEEYMLLLEGKVKLSDADGGFSVKSVGKPFASEVCGWMREKLLQVLNKHVYLSNLNQGEMYREGRIMSMMFWDELWCRSCEFNLSPSDMRQLLTMYTNSVSAAIRAPLDQGMRKTIRDTTSETTQRVEQRMTESTEKKGGLFGLFGGNR